MYKKLPNGQIIYEQDYSCVLDPKAGKGGIYIGNLEAAENLNTLKKNNIRAVLTACKGVNISHPKSQIPFYLQIHGEDRDGFDLSRYFSQAINFIRDSLENTNIMVHCLAGVSRSVCLVLAYLMKDHHMSYNEAYSMVKARRKIIHPNQGFIGQLKKYQLQLQKTCSYTPKIADKSQFSPYSASPNKKKFDYYSQIEKTGSYQSKFEASRYNNLHEEGLQRKNICGSPSKYVRQQQVIKLSKNYLPYRQDYESPVKRPSSTINYGQRKSRYIPQMDYESSRRYVHSPNKKYQYEHEGYYSPSKLKTRNISAFDDRVDYKTAAVDNYPVGRHANSTNSGSYTDKYAHELKQNVSTRLFGDNATNLRYDNYNESSASSLSEQLDRKIAKIRQKYTQYAKNDLKVSRKALGNDKDALLDQNNLLGSLKMKKMASDIQSRSRLNPQMGSIRSNYLKSSGLGMRRLNSAKEGYY